VRIDTCAQGMDGKCYAIPGLLLRRQAAEWFSDAILPGERRIAQGIVQEEKNEIDKVAVRPVSGGLSLCQGSIKNLPQS
jgi:hypothetical protein